MDKKIKLPSIKHSGPGAIPSTYVPARNIIFLSFALTMNAEIIPARKFIKEAILNNINLDEIDLVISGEGNFDFQSFEGKGAGVILDLFKNRKAKIILLNGDKIFMLFSRFYIKNLKNFNKTIISW